METLHCPWPRQIVLWGRCLCYHSRVYYFVVLLVRVNTVHWTWSPHSFLLSITKFYHQYFHASSSPFAGCKICFAPSEAVGWSQCKEKIYLRDNCKSATIKKNLHLFAVSDVADVRSGRTQRDDLKSANLSDWENTILILLAPQSARLC